MSFQQEDTTNINKIYEPNNRAKSESEKVTEIKKTTNI